MRPSYKLATHLGFLHEEGDALRVVEGHSEVDDSLSLSLHTDGSQSNVRPPVVKLADQSAPVSSFLVVASISSVRGEIELVLDTDRYIDIF